MKRSDMIGILAVAGALAFGACEQNPRSSAERGGTTSSPTSRSPTAATSPTAGGSASSMDQSGTGGAGDAGYGARDGGMR